MDGIQPVGAMIQPQPANSGLNAYSTLLGIQQQQQGLVQQRQAIQGQAAQVSQEQQKNRELTDLGNFTRQAMQPGSQYYDKQGNFDFDSYRRDATTKAPVYGPQAIDSHISAIKNVIETRKAAQSLGTQTTGQLSDSLKGLAGQGTPISDQDIENFAGGARAKIGNNPEGRELLGSFLSQLRSARDPQQRQALAANAASTLGGFSQQAPVNMDVGGKIQTGAQNVFTGALSPSGSLGKTLAPQVVTFPSGELGVMGGPGGGGSGGGPPKKSSAPQNTSSLPAMQRPGPNAPRADQENYIQRTKQLGDEYQSVSTAANDPMNGVQATRYRNQRVMDLAPNAATGPGLRALNVLASRLPGSTGDAYQDLGHYTAQNSAALAKLMGVPNTNMGQETAAAAAGNVERNPGALMEITRANDALNTGFDLYNRGMAKITNNGSDMSRAASYKQAFGQNVDVNALRWADAHRRGDQDEISAMTKKFGPQGIAQFQQKLKTLKALAEKGDVQ